VLCAALAEASGCSNGCWQPVARIATVFAIQQNAILLHKDPEFEALTDQVSLEALPYEGT
jgi:hypothetical protein